MIYYQNNDLVIRNMIPADAQAITDGEIAQGWDQTVEKYNRRLHDQAAGIAIALVAEYHGNVAGYDLLQLPMRLSVDDIDEYVIYTGYFIPEHSLASC